MMIVQHHEAPYWERKCIDTFDRLYAEGATRPRVMAIAVHPYITGQPFRIKYLEAVYAYMEHFPACCTGMANKFCSAMRRSGSRAEFG